ncbi:MAG TPA: hypothetical protein VN033_01535 [Vulgatibacter sp.]|nr:hypothetical protein [Vulgatibacter sp.]
MRRTGLAILALVALASCESGTALQLVSAKVATAAFSERPAGVGAFAGDRLLAWSPLDAEGEVLLAVPPAEAIGFSLTDADGVPVVSIEVRPDRPLLIRVCHPVPEPFDLGEIRAERLPCRPPEDCADEWEAARACRAEGGDAACIDCPPSECDAMRRILELCLDGREPACGGHRAMTSRTRPPRDGIGCEAER